eukprot:gene1071-2099_t
MPSLAVFIQDILSDPDFGSDSEEYITRLQQRINALNHSQLQGMYNHLLKTADTADSKVWKEANKSLLSHVEVFLKIRDAELAEAKRQEGNRQAKKKKKRDNKQGKAEEEARVLEHLKVKARTEAEKEVYETEMQREAAEKLEQHQKEPIAARLRMKYAIVGVLVFVIGCVIAGVAADGDALLLVLLIGISGLLSAFILWRAYKVGKIMPIEISNEEMAEAIEVREAEILQMYLNGIAEKERQYQMRDQHEREERRELRATRKLERLLAHKKNFYEDDEEEKDEDSDDSGDEDEQQDVFPRDTSTVTSPLRVSVIASDKRVPPSTSTSTVLSSSPGNTTKEMESTGNDNDNDHELPLPETETGAEHFESASTSVAIDVRPDPSDPTHPSPGSVPGSVPVPVLTDSPAQPRPILIHVAQITFTGLTAQSALPSSLASQEAINPYFVLELESSSSSSSSLPATGGAAAGVSLTSPAVKTILRSDAQTHVTGEEVFWRFASGVRRRSSSSYKKPGGRGSMFNVHEVYPEDVLVFKLYTRSNEPEKYVSLKNRNRDDNNNSAAPVLLASVVVAVLELVDLELDEQECVRFQRGCIRNNMTIPIGIVAVIKLDKLHYIDTNNVRRKSGVDDMV